MDLLILCIVGPAPTSSFQPSSLLGTFPVKNNKKSQKNSFIISDGSQNCKISNYEIIEQPQTFSQKFLEFHATFPLGSSQGCCKFWNIFLTLYKKLKISLVRSQRVAYLLLKKSRQCKSAKITWEQIEKLFYSAKLFFMKFTTISFDKYMCRKKCHSICTGNAFQFILMLFFNFVRKIKKVFFLLFL